MSFQAVKLPPQNHIPRLDVASFGCLISLASGYPSQIQALQWLQTMRLQHIEPDEQAFAARAIHSLGTATRTS